MSLLEVATELHTLQLGWLGLVWLGFFLLYLFRARVRRFFVAQLVDAQLASQWEAMPERIIFMRHGESEGNVNRAIYARVPDSMLELTDTGRQQARDAGKRLQTLLPPQTKITVVLSPFERTQQTLLSVLESLHDHKQAGHHEVVQVHDDPRIREQEFGNLQQKKAVPAHGSGDGEEDEPFLDEAQEMGRWGARFYHRREKAESPADVYDRVSDFWSSVLSQDYALRTHFDPSRQAIKGGKDSALLVVTHGMTMRLLLMRYFDWSHNTFETVFNPSNCDMWVLKKSANSRQYDLCTEECHPPRMPFASRPVQIVRNDANCVPRVRWPGDKDGGIKFIAEKFTIVDYLSIKPPRTSHVKEALAKALQGHQNLDPSRKTGKEAVMVKTRALEKVAEEGPPTENDIWYIDWWNDKVGFEGIKQRFQLEGTPTGNNLRVKAKYRGKSIRNMFLADSEESASRRRNSGFVPPDVTEQKLNAMLGTKAVKAAVVKERSGDRDEPIVGAIPAKRNVTSQSGKETADTPR